MTDKLDEIKERWRVRFCAQGESLMAQFPPTRGYIEIARGHEETVEHLAHAPEDVRWLIDQVQRLRDQVRSLASSYEA